MKTCPYCAAENRDDATVCFFCGNRLDTAPLQAAGNTAPQPGQRSEPTQPVRTRAYPPYQSNPGPYDTQQIPYTPPPPPSGSPPNYSTYPQGYGPAPAYNPPPAYIPPPPPPARANRGPSPLWTVLLFGLGAVLLFACGFAAWTLTSATGIGATRAGANFSTQVANIFSPPQANPAQPTSAVAPDTPTPWPTFTPEPSLTPQPAAAASPTADATQAMVAEKLLSTGCRNALDTLGKLSNQVSTQPTTALDGTWRANLNQAVADMKTNCGTLDAASPVPGLITEAHRNLASAQSEFDQAGKLFDDGVKNLDPSKLLEAGQHVQQAAKDLNTAIAELKKIGK